MHGFLQKHLPGDLVLADRGFTGQESVGIYCAEVKVSAFTWGRRQLSRYEVDATHQLACVQIHVERIIGVIRQKNSILESTLPINMLMCHEEEEQNIIDKIVTICSAL